MTPIRSRSLLSLPSIFGIGLLGILTLVGRGEFPEGRSALPLAPVADSGLSDAERRDAIQQMATDVQFLAADEMRGRGPGTGGLDRAAEFIARRWRDLGLNTELYDGTPFQSFTIPGSVEATKPDRNWLRWSDGGGASVALKLDRDFRPLSLGSSGRFAGELVFVGYGITAKEEGWVYDDYEGLDVRGKVVVVIRKEPRQADPESPFDGLQSSRHALFATKLANAVQHGAAGLIFVNDGVSYEKTMIALQSGEEQLPSTEDAGRSTPSRRSIPTLFVTRSVVDRWIRSMDPNLSLIKLELEIDSDLQPRSFVFGEATVSGEVFLQKSTLQVKNVIASLPGAGGLADETVVIGAHYDHVGMGGPGSLSPGSIDVHNGADDNASGTAALLEIARRFAREAKESGGARRQLVFIAFTGEERGLLGSRHYVAHPRFALESTAAMINLDMVGRMRDQQLVIFGTGSSSTFDSLIDTVNSGLGLRVRKQREASGPSDHQPFFERQVPVLHLFTGLHADYHRPSDDFEKINTEGMVWVTDIVYRLGDELSKRPVRPDYVAVQGRANIRVPIEGHPLEEAKESKATSQP